MSISVHVYHHYPEQAELLRLLRIINKRTTKMAIDLTRIETEVAENSDVIESAVILIERLAQEIRDNATNPAALNALADKLDAQSNKLGAAVEAGTPADPEAPIVDNL